MKVDIVAHATRSRELDGPAQHLENALNEIISLGYVIKFMLPNGVDRWTIVSEKAS